MAIYIIHPANLTGMEERFSVPLVIAKDSRNPIESDLTQALVFWSLEDEREKGGGLFRKKEPERITQVSFLSRQILFTKYGKSIAVFDGCGIHSTQATFGFYPGLTHLGTFLISNNWTSKTDSYIEGLDRHSQSFEQARNEHSQGIQGWITDPVLIHDLSLMLRVAHPSEPRSDALPLLVDFAKAKAELESLDKIKHLVRSELTPLLDMKQKLKEKTSEILVPLKKECSFIEEKFNREIDRIRPEVLSTKERLESEKLEQRRKIEARFSGRLHDLQNRRDAAQSKIDAYEYSDREPKGGIDKQRSIKRNSEHRIEELESEQETQTSEVDEKYKRLASEQDERIDSIERRKQDALREPKNKIQKVEKATNRLTSAIDGLLQDHENFLSLGASSELQIPESMSANEFILYLPFVQARFDNGREQRTRILVPSSLKESKGILGGIKSIMRMKTMPLEQEWEAIAPFNESLNMDSNSTRVLSVVARRNDFLSNHEVSSLLSSGITKLQSRGWISEKDATEFGKVLKEYYVQSEPPIALSSSELTPSRELQEREPEPRQPVRFVNYLGEEKLVAMDELEAARKEDETQFALGVQKLISEQRRKDNESSLLNSVVEAIQEFKPSRRYHNEFPYQAELQGWLKSRFPGSKIEIQTGASRPDIVIENIAIEVKGPTDNRALETLTSKCLKYSGYYDTIVMALFEPVFSESNFREIEAGIKRHFPHVRVIRKDETY